MVGDYYVKDLPGYHGGVWGKWLIRQTRDQHGNVVEGTNEVMGNMGNMGNIAKMDNVGNRGNIGRDTLDQMLPPYQIVLVGKKGDENEMGDYKKIKDGDQLLWSRCGEHCKRGFGRGRPVDGKIRILKRGKDLKLKRNMNGKIRILRRL